MTGARTFHENANPSIVNPIDDFSAPADFSVKRRPRQKGTLEGIIGDYF